MYQSGQSNRSFNIPPSIPGHLTPFPARGVGNLIILVFTGVRHLIATRSHNYGSCRHSWGVGNLIEGLDFISRVPLITRWLINHGGDKP